MQLVLAPPPQHRVLRLLAFAVETHPPLLYGAISAGWVGSLLALMDAPAWPPSAAGLAVLFYLVLLYLRAVDEIKDLPYDRVHHPGRPLVRGAVAEGEVWALAGVVALAVLALAAWLSPWLAVGVGLQLAYGLGLLVLERRWAFMRDSILLNLCVTFPVSAVLNGWAWLLLASQGSTPPVKQALWAGAAHVAVFLHMEFGRKLQWPSRMRPGENGYAMALGVPGAVAVCGALGLAACVLATRLGANAGVWLALLPSCAGFWLFWRDRRIGDLGQGVKGRELKPWFGGAMIVFFWANALAWLWR